MKEKGKEKKRLLTGIRPAVFWGFAKNPANRTNKTCSSISTENPFRASYKLLAHR